VESDPEPDTNSAEEVSGEKQEELAAQEEGQTNSPPPDRPEVEDRAGLEEEEQAVEKSPSLACSIPVEPAGGQEAQGKFTPDPNLTLDVREWQELQAQGLRVMDGFGADMTLAQPAGFMANLSGQLQRELVF
jgi:hypothetical protein